MRGPAENRYPTLFSPFTLAGHRLRNRIVHASISTRFSRGGLVTRPLIDYFANRARGGAAMIVSEVLAGLPAQRGGYRVLVGDEKNRAGLKRWAEAVERHDCRLLGQLMEPGRGWHHPGRNPKAVGPSPLADPLSWTVPHVLTPADLERMVEEFAAAARRLQESGFSGVELSCGHGYLFHQFLSPRSNRREDAYGGDVAGRTLLLRNLIRAIRAVCGDGFLIGLKLPGEDGEPGGIDVAEAARIVRQIVPLRVADYFCFAQGSHHRSLEMHVPDMHYPPLPYRDITGALHGAAQGTPVVALGRISEPAQAEALLADGVAELVMLGRTLLADPAWGNKARAGREEEIRVCHACNACWGEIVNGHPLCCVVNQRVGTPNEAIWKPRPARTRRVLVVIGSGIAGLEAAWLAAARGHAVTLFGRSREVGGKLRLNALLPGCAELGRVYRYQQRAALRAGVRFELGVRAGWQDVLACTPQAVVLATGSAMTWPERLPAALRKEGAVRDLRAVVADLLGRPGRQGGTAVLYDHDQTAATYAAAAFLKERFDRVVLLTPREKLAQDEPLVIAQGICRRIYGGGIETVVLVEPAPATPFAQGRVRYANVYTGEEGEIADVALFTYATPRVPEQIAGLPPDAVPEGIALHRIGDCYAPRDALAAMREAHAVGTGL